MCYQQVPKIERWKGPLYEDGLNGVRLMIVGESHYDSPQNPTPHGRQYTKGTIRRYVQGTTFKFMNNVIRLVSGQEPRNLEVRRQFFDHVIFYNYIQHILGDNGETRTLAMWCEGFVPFVNTIKALEVKPDLVVVFSRIAWRYLPLDLVEQETFPGQMKVLRIPYHPVKILGVYHPSARGAHKAATIRAIRHAMRGARGNND